MIDFNKITFENFQTPLYRLSFTSSRYQLLNPNVDGFIKNKNEISKIQKTLSKEEIKKWMTN